LLLEIRPKGNVYNRHLHSFPTRRSSDLKETIQKNASADSLNSVVPFLGIIGEIGSLVTELKKKFRDGDAYVAYKAKLCEELGDVDRKSTRLNSSHVKISYAVFCLKKKKE